MAQIGEVYGENYSEQSKFGRMKYAVKLIAMNIANKNFSFRHDSSELWKEHNMTLDAIRLLLQQVQTVNPKVRITHIDKTTDKINIFPVLINGPVEYFVLTDLSDQQIKLYSIYITPSLMEAC